MVVLQSFAESHQQKRARKLCSATLNQIHLMFSCFPNVVTVFVLDLNNNDIPHKVCKALQITRHFQTHFLA